MDKDEKDSINLVDRQILTKDEAKQAVENAIKDSGFILEQLEEQAKNNTFETTQARICWIVINTLKS